MVTCTALFCCLLIPRLQTLLVSVDIELHALVMNVCVVDNIVSFIILVVPFESFIVRI